MIATVCRLLMFFLVKSCQLIFQTTRKLALCCFSSGAHERAEALYEDAVRSCRQMFGDHALETAKAIADLGGFYAEQDQIDRAEGLLNQVVDIYRVNLPDDDPYWMDVLPKLVSHCQLVCNGSSLHLPSRIPYLMLVLLAKPRHGAVL